MLPIAAALLLKTASIRAQVVLDASVTHLAAQPLSMCHQNSVQPENSLRQERTHAEDFEGWWLSGYHGSVAEHWQLKPEVSWVQLLATAHLFTFLYFCLITIPFWHVLFLALCESYTGESIERENFLTYTVSRVATRKPRRAGTDGKWSSGQLEACSSLHPSWAAIRQKKAKEGGIKEFQGQRIVFSDSD